MRAYRIAYDGRPFHGFQRQPTVPTVEDALLDALASLGVTDGAPPPGYAAAGRTDAGVSALAQTVAFEAPDWLEPRAMNADLPGSIRAWASADVSADFHATRDAASREYVYHLHAPAVDPDRLRTALSRLEGTHDFHNLTAADGDTERTVLSTGVTADGEFRVLRIRAEGFLHEMVRRVVTLLVGVARDEGPSVDRALAAEPLEGPEGIGPAAPEPLVLTDVHYPGESFAVDSEAARSLARGFEARRVEAATRARVAGTILDGTGSPDVDRRN